MKAIIEIVSGRVTYLLRAAEITDSGLLSDGVFVALDVRPTTHSVIDAPEPIPTPWVDGAYAIVDDSWVTVDNTAIADARATELEIVRHSALSRINAEVTHLRSSIITVLPGQDATYQRKEYEAHRYLADVDPDPINYPYLAAEASALNITLGELAADVAATAALWHSINAAIEAARRSASTRVAAATNVADILTIFPITWPEM